MELSLFSLADLTTVVVTVVAGVVVLVVACFTSCFAAGGGLDGVCLLAASRMASDGLELPVPLAGTVVLVTGFTVVAVVDGGASVPWVPTGDGAPAGAVAGAVWAEAGREPSRTKSPARSANDAAHLRGLTTSLLGLTLICLDRSP